MVDSIEENCNRKGFQINYDVRNIELNETYCKWVKLSYRNKESIYKKIMIQ